MKKIMLLIVFTVLVLACAINYKTVFQYIAVFFGIIFPEKAVLVQIRFCDFFSFILFGFSGI